MLELPDGIFSNQNLQFGKIFYSLAMKDVVIFLTVGLFYGHFCIFYDHLVYFVIIWYIFPRFGIFYKEKSGNPVTTGGCLVGG
jgi:hypothetical protein